MREYLKDKKVPDKLINNIADAIMATKMSVNPRSLTEAIICDADTYHLGTSDFFDIDRLVWQEVEMRLNAAVTDKREKTLAFLQSHNFYTSYCKRHLDKEKQKNIKIIKTILHDDKK